MWHEDRNETLAPRTAARHRFITEHRDEEPRTACIINEMYWYLPLSVN